MKDRRTSPDFTLKNALTEYFGKEHALVAKLYEKSKAAGESVLTLQKFKTDLIDFATGLIATTDFITAGPAWLRAYEKKIAKGATDAEAVKYADRLIDLTIGTGRKFDTPGLFRGGTVARMITVFRTFMNNQFNRFLKEYDLVVKKKDYGRFAGYVLANLIIFPILSQILAGRWHDDDDKEDLATWAVSTVARDNLGMIPFFGDAAGYMVDRALGVRTYSPRLSPVLSAVNNIFYETPSAILKFGQGDMDTQDFIEKMSRTGTFLFGTPDYLNQMFFNGLDYIDGGVDPSLKHAYKRIPKKDR